MKKLFIPALLLVCSQVHADCISAVKNTPELTIKEKASVKLLAYNFNKYSREIGYPTKPGLEACYMTFYTYAKHSEQILEACDIEEKMDDEMYFSLTGRKFPDCRE